MAADQPTEPESESTDFGAGLGTATRPGLGAGRLASNKRRTAYYAERDWLSLQRGSELRSLESMAGERVRYIVADQRVALLPSRGFALLERYRVAAGGHGARVYWLTRSTPVGSPQVSAGIGAGPPNFATH